EVDSIRITSGRPFTDADLAGAERVVIISHALAHQVFGDDDPVGRTLSTDDDGARSMARIIGVASDVAQEGPRDGATPIVYEPLTQVGQWPYVELLIHARDGSEAITRAVADTVRAAAPGIRVRNTGTASDRLASWLLRELLVASLASLFGVIALGLAAIGIY